MTAKLNHWVILLSTQNQIIENSFMNTLLRNFVLLVLLCLSPALAKPEWLSIGMKSKVITSNIYKEHNVKSLANIKTNITFLFKNNSSYQAILGVKNPTFYVSGYIEMRNMYSKKWGQREYFNNITLTSGTPKSVEIFPGKSSAITYGTWTFAQVTGKKFKSTYSTDQARVVLTKVSGKCSLTTREMAGAGFAPKPKPKPRPAPVSQGGEMRGSSAKLPPWLSVKRTKFSFSFSAKPLKMMYHVTYNIANHSSLYAISGMSNRRILMSKMRYSYNNKYYNCGTTSANIKFNNQHFELMPKRSVNMNFNINLIPYAKTPSDLFNRKVREGSKSAIKINNESRLLFDFTYVQR